jgi:uncharacterized protein (DUF58 family)
VTPTARCAALVAVAALSAVWLGAGVAVLALLAVLAATAVDARVARRPVDVRRRLPAVLSRGIPVALAVRTDAPGRPAPRLRQAFGPDLLVTPSEGRGPLAAEVVGRRRGRHPVVPVAVRVEGPLGLGAWDHHGGGEAEVLVYPDLATARRLALAVRQGRFRDPGRRTRGPLGLGTEFEAVRDYLPDDDLRQVNWPATQRLGRPMSNVYRLEEDREVVCLVDAGRLMAAPVADGPGTERTRLDAAIDAAAAVALVADEVGDRVGTVAFDVEIRRRLSPRHRGADAVVRALFDVEPVAVDSDYEQAFRAVEQGKRRLVLVLTDLLETTAARALLDALPLLARRHHVVVAGAADPDLDALVRTPPRRALDVYAAAAALDVLDARRLVAGRLQAAGADVVQAPADRLPAACVGAYLRAKRRARL